MLKNPYPPRSQASIRPSAVTPPKPVASTKVKMSRFVLLPHPETRSFGFVYRGPTVEGVFERLSAIPTLRLRGARVFPGKKLLEFEVSLQSGHDYGAYQAFFSIGRELNEIGEVTDLNAVG